MDVALIIEWIASSGMRLHPAGHWVDPLGNTVARCTGDMIEMATVSITGIVERKVSKLVIRDWNPGKAGRKMIARWPSNYTRSTSYNPSVCACCEGTIPRGEDKYRMNGESICSPCMGKWEGSNLELAVFRKLLKNTLDF